MSIQHLTKDDIREIKKCLGDTTAVRQFISRADSLITNLEALRILWQRLPYKIEPKRQRKLYKSIEKAATNLRHTLSQLKSGQYRDLAALSVLLREDIHVERFEKLKKELAWLSGLFNRAANSVAQVQKIGEDLGIYQKGAGRPIKRELTKILDTLVTIYRQEFGELPAYSKHSKFHVVVVVIVNRAGISRSENLESGLKAAIDRVKIGQAATIGCKISPK